MVRPASDQKRGEGMSVLRFFNTKGRSLTVFLFSILSGAIMIASTLLANDISQKWYGLIAGVIMMTAAIPFHILGKKNNIAYLFAILLNSIGAGFSASAYYIQRGITVDLQDMILSAGSAFSLLLLVYIVIQISPKSKKITLCAAVILTFARLIAVLVRWIRDDPAYYSFCFFCLLISLFYLCVFGVTVNHDERSLLRDISFGNFGLYVMITVVVIFILTEGEILDGIGGIGSKEKGSKKSE